MRSVVGLKDRIDAVRMLLDVGVEFHGQQSGFVGIVGVEAGFELLAVGVLVTNGVGGQSLIGFGHDSRGVTRPRWHLQCISRHNHLFMFSFQRFVKFLGLFSPGKK